MDRYYTPSIEEFYINFEYEILSIDGCSTDDDDWNSFVFGTDMDLYTFTGNDWLGALRYYLGEGRIRVKHLDRSDIESLGFKFFGRAITPPSSVVVYNTGFNKDDDFLLRQEGLSVSVSRQNGGDLFNGTIKNKSELKRILKQVGYEV